MRPRLAVPVVSFLTAAFIAHPTATRAQLFDSGSDGSDGALLIQPGAMPLQIQEDGVHNYTTITIESGATLRFLPNSLNTPVIFLATDDVEVSGTLDLRGENGASNGDPDAGVPGSEAQPGPGGFPGGRGGLSTPNEVSIGTSGGGPGGGASPFGDPVTGSNRGPAGGGGSHFVPGGTGTGNSNPPAPTYGDPRLFTLTGGSGGAGGAVFVTSGTTSDGANGGAGGGALLIASSGNIEVNGSIEANGGVGQNAVSFSGGGTEGAGGGAGGAVRLMANSITGVGSVTAGGGSGANGSASGGSGRIVFEAFDMQGNIVQNSTPVPIVGLPSLVSLPPMFVPTITVVSIGGVSVPPNPTGSTTMPDLAVPDSVSNPVEIVFATTNVPDGAVINARIILSTGETFDATSGPVASGSASLSLDLPASVGVVYATADFDPTP